MTQSGVLLATKRGREVNYEPNPACPFLPELRSLLLKTRGLVDVLRNALARHSSSIKIAFIYGSFAAGTESSTSDVDLIVIGDATLLSLTPELHTAETSLGRPVNIRLLSGHGLREGLEHKSHFLRSVLDKPKIFVVGTEDDLGRIVGRAAFGRRDIHSS